MLPHAWPHGRYPSEGKFLEAFSLFGREIRESFVESAVASVAEYVLRVQILLPQRIVVELIRALARGGLRRVTEIPSADVGVELRHLRRE